MILYLAEVFSIGFNQAISKSRFYIESLCILFFLLAINQIIHPNSNQTEAEFVGYQGTFELIIFFRGLSLMSLMYEFNEFKLIYKTISTIY